MSINLDTLPAWLDFVDSVTPSSSDGTSTPVVEHHQHMRTAVLGPYAQRLREDVFNFLVVTLPSLVNFGTPSTPATPTAPDGATHPADTGRDTLLQVFSRVPFDLFKAAVESPTFNLGRRLSLRMMLRSDVTASCRVQGRPTRDSSSARTPSSCARRASRAGRRRPSCSPLAGARASRRACSSRASSAAASSTRSATRRAPPPRPLAPPRAT